jgi:hypothetical protein
MMIKFDEGWGMDLISVFPSVVAFRIAFPLDQILQGFALPPGPMGTYLFHFVFRFSIYQVQWQSGEVGAMRRCFSVSRHQTGMEDWVDAPLSWEFELDHHR